MEIIDNRIENNFCHVKEIEYTYPNTTYITIEKCMSGTNRNIINFKYSSLDITMSIDNVFGFIDFNFSDWISFKTDGTDKVTKMSEIDNLCKTIIKDIVVYFKTYDNTIYQKIKFLE
jgi:hypothetical protein